MLCVQYCLDTGLILISYGVYSFTLVFSVAMLYHCAVRRFFWLPVKCRTGELHSACYLSVLKKPKEQLEHSTHSKLLKYWIYKNQIRRCIVRLQGRLRIFCSKIMIPEDIQNSLVFLLVHVVCHILSSLNHFAWKLCHSLYSCHCLFGHIVSVVHGVIWSYFRSHIVWELKPLNTLSLPYIPRAELLLLLKCFVGFFHSWL